MPFFISLASAKVIEIELNAHTHTHTLLSFIKDEAF